MKKSQLRQIVKEEIKKILIEINEAKQVGNLYHFTSVENLLNILNDGFLEPNEQGQVSTTRNKKVDVYPFMGEVPSYLSRITLDGDKISNKYKIRPYNYDEDIIPQDREPAYLSKFEYEEQIITNSKNLSLYPYLVKIDLFIKNKKNEDVSEVIDILDEKNINYEIHLGPYKSY
jgi:hypothetical protein